MKRFDQELARWYELIPHPVQLELIQAVDKGIRFPVVPAGRRSGKTERAKRFLVSRAMTTPGIYFAAAPTYNQAKKIWWDDLRLLSLTSLYKQPPITTDLKIFIPGGSEIHVIGLDKPKRIEGIEWTGGVIDEVADVKAAAVEENILPALDTVNPTRPDYRAWCWFIGVPDGLNHYYDMAERAKNPYEKDWELFTWHSDEILPKDIIDAAKNRMSPKQYRQEYQASFETATGRIYEDYSTANVTDAEIMPNEVLHWTHDQNFTPLSSAIIAVRKNNALLLDEIVLESAISRQSALEFVEKYKNHKNKQVFVYGDPAGRAGEKHGHRSDYTDIEEILKLSGWKYERRVKMAHPAIKDRQNAVRARILNAKGEINLFVNPKKAPWCHRGLSTVQFKEGSSFQEDDTNKYQHITTAIGYFVDFLWPVGTPRIDNTRTTGYY